MKMKQNGYHKLLQYTILELKYSIYQIQLNTPPAKAGGVFKYVYAFL